MFKLKSIKFSVTIWSLFFLFASCDTIGTEEVQPDYDLKESLTVEDGQNQFSQTFISMGIVKAKVE